MKNVVSLKSLAEELQVSISTVSKSLNNSEEISVRTKERVRRLAELRGYKPNPIAVSLKKQTTMQIGVVLPTIENPFFASVLKGIDTLIGTTSYNIITLFSNELLSKEKECLSFFSRGNVEGILMCTAEEANAKQSYAHIEEMRKSKIPMVLFDRIPKQSLGFDTIGVNDFESIANAYAHLENKGAKTIVFVSSIPNLVVGKRRVEGYESKTKKPIYIASENLEELKEKITKTLANTEVDGIIAADIDATLLCNSEIVKRKLSYKNDISLIGYVNTAHNNLMFPKLSYIDQHPKSMGEKAAEMLLERIHSAEKYTPETKILPTEIIIEESSL